MITRRNSSVELLRILSMLTIVGVHYWGCCGTLDKITCENSSFEVMKVLQILFSYGVNLFVIITGYYMIDRVKVNFRKAFRLLWQIAFYGCVLFFVSILIGVNIFSVGGLVKSIFPMLWGMRWFVKAYIILYLFSPYINKLLNGISQKSHGILIVLLLVLFSIWPFLLPCPPVDDYGFGYQNFIVLYVIASYLRKYGAGLSLRLCWWSFLSCTALLFGLMYVESSLPILATMKTMALAHNSPIKLMACFSLFMIFVKRTWYNNFVNVLAAGAFSVYVIHGDFNTMDWMFTTLFKANDYQYGWIWLPHFLSTIVAIYMACFMIDYVIQKSICRVFDRVFDKVKFLNFEIVS